MKESKIESYTSQRVEERFPCCYHPLQLFPLHTFPFNVICSLASSAWDVPEQWDSSINNASLLAFVMQWMTWTFWRWMQTHISSMTTSIFFLFFPLANAFLLWQKPQGNISPMKGTINKPIWGYPFPPSLLYEWCPFHVHFIWKSGSANLEAPWSMHIRQYSGNISINFLP